MLYSPHCFPFVGPWGLPRRLFALSVERALSPLTDAIVCVADEERRVALREHVAPDHKLHVVHNGSSRCAGDLAPDDGLARFRASGPLAACITVLRPQKSVDVFLDAAPRVLAELPEARLAVVGDGSLRADLQAKARAWLSIPSAFASLTFVSPAARQLSSVDLFVLPSAREAFPISILEAMACAVSQVAIDDRGMAEALVDGETGFLCSLGDPLALAERIVQALREPDRLAVMGEAGRERHDALFTVEPHSRADGWGLRART